MREGSYGNFFGEAVSDVLASALVLRCSVCRHREPVGDIGSYERDGWPKHCGETLRLADPTARDITNGTERLGGIRWEEKR